MASYTNSSNSYFKQLPRLDYPSLANDRTSVYDYQIVKNFFKRAVLRNDILNDTVSFEKYTVQDKPNDLPKRTDINILLNRVKLNQKNESRKKIYFSAAASAGLFLFGLIIF